MNETREQRLALANEILALYAPECRLELRGGRTWIAYTCPWGKHSTARAAVLNRSGNSLACRYGALGMGGTCATATANLVLWIRDEARAPVGWWRYWTSPTVALGREAGARILELLEASSYADSAKTGCVFCGSAKVVDWWSRDGDPTGPCCSHQGCHQVDVHSRQAARRTEAVA